jgi:homogentisate 1,2-dioxygenase
MSQSTRSQSKGRVARQTHVGVPAGLVEEEHGRDAFSGPVSHLYRTAPPTAWVDVDGPLRPLAFDLNRLDVPAEGRTLVLHNDDLAVSVSQLAAPMPFANRNGDADEIVYVHEGSGELQTDYGPLAFAAQDYLVLPRGTAHRFVPTEPCLLYVMESVAPVTRPDFGLLGRHAVVDPRVLVTPEPYDAPPSDWVADADGRWRLRVRRRGQWTTFRYPHNPFNAVGWAGDLAPHRLSVRDIRPVTAPGYHLPPSVHTTFRCGGFDIATFVPRPFETDPEALRVPFFHANVDNDEVIFYSRGDFFSRRGIGQGWLTLHPAGVQHGPQPGAAEAAAKLEGTSEVAVMIECRNPLTVSPQAEACVDAAYTTSWARGLGLMD